MIKKYWPTITEVNEKPNASSVNPVKFKIDKSDIEDAEFTEIDEKK